MYAQLVKIIIRARIGGCSTIFFFFYVPLVIIFVGTSIFANSFHKKKKKKHDVFINSDIIRVFVENLYYRAIASSDK